MNRLTLALSGTQLAPRSGNLMLRVCDERPVKRHRAPYCQYVLIAFVGT